jgi:very-short-patch-repair endonuclease
VPPDQAIKLARQLRRNSTEVERLLWSKLRAGRLNDFPFKRQFPCCGYILDFACVSQRLNIELDGSQHADNPADVIRDRVLTGQGWRVLRFWNNEVNGNLAGVLETILDALSAPSLTLPRCAGEGTPLSCSSPSPAQRGRVGRGQ